MATDSPPNSLSSSPLKRLKTSTNSNSTSTMETKAKNNEPQEEEKACGICMTKHGHGAVRGELDCCDHLFCFVCILLWAKVESLCPACKCRFTTVRRPPQYEHGVFPFERVVNIPKRDQVYDDTSGNTTIAYVDPFAKAQCIVCKGVEDESLLVVCDLCDSTVHTYCVDLGATVPEDDWFCQDCCVSRAEHENFLWSCKDNGQSVNVESELLAEPCVSAFSVDADANSVDDSDIITTAEDVVSVSDIVHEPYDPSLSCHQVKFFRHPVPIRKPNRAVEVTMPSQRIPQIDAFQSRARTLRQGHSVNRSIQALRENWDALRNGSLSFSSLSVESSSQSCRTRICSNQQCSVSSTSSSRQRTAQVGYLGSATQDWHSYTIQKAWRMMDKVKSIQKATRTSTSIHQSSKYPSGRGNVSKEATDQSLNLHLTKSKQFDTRELGGTKTEKQCGCQHQSHEKETEKHISQKWEKQKQGQVMKKEILELSNSLSTSYSPAWEVQTSSHVDVYQENGSTKIPKNLCKNSLSVSNEQHASTCMLTLVEAVPGAAGSLKTKPKLCASSSCKVNISEGKVHSKKASAESNMRKDHNAKREILSLVKRNLRLLIRNKQLGYNEFKEVARLATHTILAACGFGSRYVIQSLPTSSCSHSEQNMQFQKSTLMPDSCRECFYVFVKDVVNSILAEKNKSCRVILPRFGAARLPKSTLEDFILPLVVFDEGM